MLVIIMKPVAGFSPIRLAVIISDWEAVKA